MKNDNSLKIIKRLYKEYVSCYKSRLFLITIFLVIGGVLTAANAKIIEPAIDELFINKDSTKTFIICAIILAIGFLNAGCNYGQSILMSWIGIKVSTKMQVDLFDKLIHSDIKHHSNNSSGKLISRFTVDIQNIRTKLAAVLVMVTQDLIKIIALVGVMIHHSPFLSFVALVIIPLIILPIVNLGKSVRKNSLKNQKEFGIFTSNLDDSFQNVKTVKSYTAEDFEMKRAKTSLDKIFSIYYKMIKTSLAASPLMEVVVSFVVCLVLVAGTYNLDQNSNTAMTAGEFMSFLVAMLMAYKPIKSIAKINSSIQEVSASAIRFYEVMDSDTEIKDSADAKDYNFKKANINFDNVNFEYNKKIPAINNFSLQIEHNKKIALIGSSGAGKSTIFNLMQRFYDVNSGAIKINNKNIRDITLKSLRKGIAVVNQEATIFEDNIFNNIAYGDENPNKKRIEQAAKDAFAHDFIMELEDNYQTHIGKNGNKLSGGQKQRIALARAFYKNAPILLLDEATSALDNKSEKYIKQALQKLMQNKTVIMIAHRLSTIEDLDQIIVMENGKIKEQGTHEELIENKNSVYNKLRNS